MEDHEEAFCVTRKYFGTNNQYIVRRVDEIYRRDEELMTFVPCTVEDLSDKNITFRLKLKSQANQKQNRYEHVAIVKVTGTRTEAEDYIPNASSKRGRGTRIRVTNLKRITPQIVTSARQNKKHRAAVLHEHGNIRIVAKQKKQSIVRARKKIELAVMKRALLDKGKSDNSEQPKGDVPSVMIRELTVKETQSEISEESDNKMSTSKISDVITTVSKVPLTRKEVNENELSKLSTGCPNTLEACRSETSDITTALKAPLTVSGNEKEGFREQTDETLIQPEAHTSGISEMYSAAALTVMWTENDNKENHLEKQSAAIPITFKVGTLETSDSNTTISKECSTRIDDIENELAKHSASSPMTSACTPETLDMMTTFQGPSTLKGNNDKDFREQLDIAFIPPEGYTSKIPEMYSTAALKVPCTQNEDNTQEKESTNIPITSEVRTSETCNFNGTVSIELSIQYEDKEKDLTKRSFSSPIALQACSSKILDITTALNVPVPLTGSDKKDFEKQSIDAPSRNKDNENNIRNQLTNPPITPDIRISETCDFQQALLEVPLEPNEDKENESAKKSTVTREVRTLKTSDVTTTVLERPLIRNKVTEMELEKQSTGDSMTALGKFVHCDTIISSPDTTMSCTIPLCQSRLALSATVPRTRTKPIVRSQQVITESDTEMSEMLNYRLLLLKKEKCSQHIPKVKLTSQHNRATPSPQRQYTVTPQRTGYPLYVSTALGKQNTDTSDLYDYETNTSFNSEKANNIDDATTYNSELASSFAGLKNSGATCYMNSILQSLYHATPFREAILAVPTENGPKKTIVKILQTIFKKLKTSQQSVETTELIYYLKSVKFDASCQQDAHEFLYLLFNKVDEELTNIWHTNTVGNCFMGTSVTTIIRQNVTGSSVERQIFYAIELDVKGMANIDESLVFYTNAKSLEENTEETMIKIAFEEFPRILYLNLLRYSYNPDTSNYDKYNDKFDFSKKINLNQYLNKSKNSTDAKYTLQSVIAHSGNRNRGHYVTFIDPYCNGKWYRFNDETVTRCTQRKAINDNYGGASDTKIAEDCPSAYILVYVQDSILDTFLTTADSSSSKRYTMGANLISGISPKSISRYDSIGTMDNFNENSAITSTSEIEHPNEKTTERVVSKTKKKLNKNRNKRRVLKSTHRSKKKDSKKNKKDRISKKPIPGVTSSRIVQLKKTEERIMSAIKNVKSFANNNDIDAISLPTVADGDGKVECIEGIRVYFDPYRKAADANTMRKRLNEVINALWTKEEQLNLSVDNKHVNRYKRISTNELNNIRKICLHLQKHQSLNYTRLFSDMNLWISAKLKNQRNRWSSLGKRKNTKNTLGVKKKSKNCIISSTSECSESSDNDNDESTKVTVAKVKMPGKGKGTKKKRIVISELTSENEGHDTYDAMPQKKPKCVEPRPFSHLVSLLNASRYPLQMINAADIETVPLAAYSWADILKEMEWSDMDLHRVMTPDSYVIIDGKCHVVDITYESKVLHHLCAIMKENKCSSDKVDKNSIMEAIDKHAKYPIQILEYVFEKYMILNGGESSSTYRCNEEMMYKLISLDILQSQVALSYYELIGRIQTAHNFSLIALTDEESLKPYGTVYTSDETASGLKIVKLAENHELFEYEGIAIMKKNYAKLIYAVTRV